MKTKRKLIGMVVATVEFNLYEGEKTDGAWDWFVYEDASLIWPAVYRRECRTLEAKVVILDPTESA